MDTCCKKVNKLKYGDQMLSLCELKSLLIDLSNGVILHK